MKKEKRFKDTLLKIHKSEHLQDWKLVLILIIFLELCASALEFYFTEATQSYVQIVPDSLGKEIGIALLLVLFIWTSVYNFIFAKRNIFIFLFAYACFGTYFIITHDYTFSLMFHNLNLIEVVHDDGYFMILLQLGFKLVLAYLIYRLILSLK